MLLMTSPPSEPHAGHQHCISRTPHLPLPSPARPLACVAAPLLSLPALSSSVLLSLSLAVGSFGTGAGWGVPANPLFGGRRGA